MRKWKKSSTELITFFQKVIPHDKFIEHRKMFGYPCAFINGHMFTGLHEENMILRLAESDRQKFCRKYETHLFEPLPGRIMKEYVILPDELKHYQKLFSPWLKKSLDYVASLPPKAKKIARK